MNDPQLPTTMVTTLFNTGEKADNQNVDNKIPLYKAQAKLK